MHKQIYSNPKLFETKYIIRDFDQMSKIASYFFSEVNVKLNESKNETHDINFDKLTIILKKYLLCLKSQQNLNSIYNRFSNHVLFDLLKMIEKLKLVGNQESRQVSDLAWNVITHSLLSKYHSNVYTEFFKNLPNSFSPKSNYLVSSLFSSVQNESRKNLFNMQSICENIYVIVKNLFSILNLDYKLNITIIQFMNDLIWNFNDVTFESHSDQERDNLIIRALTSLIRLVDELNLFNQVDDNKNEGLFKNWCKVLLKKSYKFKFNETYSEFLISFLKIDHLMLEQDIDLILTNLHKEDNIHKFLCTYFDFSIKFRQFFRASHKIIDILSRNQSLCLPSSFYEFYGKSLEHFNVDVQTIANLWNDINSYLGSCCDDNKNFRTELIKFLNCVLLRVNLHSNRITSSLRKQFIKLLKESKYILMDILNNSKFDSQDLPIYLNCLFSCGLVFIINYRFSLITTKDTLSESTNLTHDPDCQEDLNEFLNDLNINFKLNEKIDKEIIAVSNYKILFYLNQLQLINVYALNMMDNIPNENFLDYLFHESFGISADTNQKFEYKTKNFNLETNIDNKFEYSIYHAKNLIIDNIYLLLPLIKSNSKHVQTSFKYVYELSLILNENFYLDPINRNEIFNNSLLLDDLFIAFIDLLIEKSSSNNNKYLQNLQEYLKSKIKSDSQKVLFNEKSYKKFQINETQINLFYHFIKLIPAEYVDLNYGFILFLLNEKMTGSDNLNIINLENYDRIMSHNLINNLPPSKLETWLSNLFRLVSEKNNFDEIERKLVEKLIQKCIYALAREKAHDNLISLIENLFGLLEANQKNDCFVSIVQLTLIQILDRVIKIKEILSNNEHKHDNQSSLNKVIIKLFTYFIELNYQSEEVSKIENHNFYLCSNLMRHLSSSKEKNQELIGYFKILLKYCLKDHKHKMKKVKNLNEERMIVDEQDSLSEKISINMFYITFLKTYLVNLTKLTDFIEDNEKIVQKIKIFKDILKLYLNYNEKTFIFEDKKHNTVQQHDNKIFDSNEYLVNVLVQSFNCLSLEDFKKLIELFDTELKNCFKEENLKIDCLIKLTVLFKAACSDYELSDQFKEDFAIFVQKYLIQIHPILYTLLSDQDLEPVISILNLVYSICASKYILLPSHLIISTLQIYVSISFENINIKDYVRIQEIACKTINLILTRYSKKFHKIAAVVCNLFIKLISHTTSISNQNHLIDSDKINQSLKAAQDLERVITQLSLFKKDFSKISPYMISEYVCKANLIAVHPSVKKTLTNTIYNLISLCDIHGISQLHVILPMGPKELFKNVYGEYEKYFKYTGKA